MIAYVIAIALAGQCQGGYCPTPSPTLPAKIIVPAQSGSYYTQDGRIVDWRRQPDGSTAWNYREPKPKPGPKPEPKPLPKKPGPSSSGTEESLKPSAPTVNYGLDLSTINPASIGHLDTNDPDIGAAMGLTEDASQGDWLKPKIEPKMSVNLSPQSVLTIGAALAVLVILARRK